MNILLVSCHKPPRSFILRTSNCIIQFSTKKKREKFKRKNKCFEIALHFLSLKLCNNSNTNWNYFFFFFITDGCKLVFRSLPALYYFIMFFFSFSLAELDEDMFSVLNIFNIFFCVLPFVSYQSNITQYLSEFIRIFVWIHFFCCSLYTVTSGCCFYFCSLSLSMFALKH